jgi:nitrite reductase/ring-hydroxylating ferredoxin subunit
MTMQTLPAGWFQIGWSHEVQRGDVRPLRFFGEDLVLCRYESGEIGLFDAYCPHMNANIGFGGATVGDTLVCPYHGWRFDRAGCNTLIPYSDRLNRSKGLRVWNVQEVGRSIILAWYSPDESSPTFDPPDTSALPGLGDPAFYEIGPSSSRHYANLPMQVDFVSENTVDMSHFKFVHETPEIGTMLQLDPIDHRLRVQFSMPMKLYRSDGGGGIEDAVTEVTNWGLGLIMGQFADGSVLLQAQTPVDDTLCDLMLTMVLPRNDSETTEPTGNQVARIKMAWRQVENDIVIWTHRRRGSKTRPIAEEVAAFKTFATWKRQFYLPTSNGSEGELVGTPSGQGSRSQSEVGS